MSEHGTAAESGPVDLYLRHREEWVRGRPFPAASDHSLEWQARRELEPLALTIAELIDAQHLSERVPVGWSDPHVPAGVSSEPEGGGTWSADAVREHLAPVAAALRAVGEGLDAVDALRLDADYLDKHGRGGTPDVVLASLGQILGDARAAVLVDRGLTGAVFGYLRYRYLRVGDRTVTVRPPEPWQGAARSVADGLTAYCAVSIERHQDAHALLRDIRRRNARGLPPDHWGW